MNDQFDKLTTILNEFFIDIADQSSAAGLNQILKTQLNTPAKYLPFIEKYNYWCYYVGGTSYVYLDGMIIDDDWLDNYFKSGSYTKRDNSKSLALLNALTEYKSTKDLSSFVTLLDFFTFTHFINPGTCIPLRALKRLIASTCFIDQYGDPNFSEHLLHLPIIQNIADMWIDIFSESYYEIDLNGDVILKVNDPDSDIYFKFTKHEKQFHFPVYKAHQVKKHTKTININHFEKWNFFSKSFPNPST
jgi:hypothetical protein